MNDDPPIDLLRVAADDAALEQLRSASNPAGDPGLALLRALLADVEKDLPVDPPAVRGSTVLTLASEQTPDRRLARSGTVVALLAAGLVSLGGVAAASTLAPAGSPLHGLGETVRSAAGAVVDAVTPPAPSAGRPAGAAAGAGAEVRPGAPTAPPAARLARPPGDPVAGAVRSAAAARSVAALLDQAAAQLDQGRLPAASARLDAAERRLTEVLPAERRALSTRLAALRDRLDQAQEAERTELAEKAERAGQAAAPAAEAEKQPGAPEPRGQQPPAPKPKAKAPADQGTAPAAPRPAQHSGGDAQPDPALVERVAPRTERRESTGRKPAPQLSRTPSLEPQA